MLIELEWKTWYCLCPYF